MINIDTKFAVNCGGELSMPNIINMPSKVCHTPSTKTMPTFGFVWHDVICRGEWSFAPGVGVGKILDLFKSG